MKSNTNDRELLGKNIDDKYVLLYQIWKELTDFRTLDSYQYRIMNTLSAMNELADVLNSRLCRIHNTNHNIDECKAETMSIVKGDSIFKNNYPMYWNSALDHLAGKTETDAQQRALRYQLEYIYNFAAEGYYKKLVETFEKDISDRNSKGIIDNANRVISICVARGWSANALYDFADILLNSKIDNSKWEKFKSRLLKDKSDEYHVLIPLKVRMTAKKVTHEAAMAKLIESIKSMEISVLDYEKLKNEYSYISLPENDEKYVDIAVSAYDYYSASHLALSKYANILNMFSFYNMIEAWSVKDISWNVINIEAQQCKEMRPKDLYGTYDYLDSANKTLKDSLQIAKGENLLQTRLNAVYSYANVGKASYAIEEKYMNIWVALESLCRSDVYENIISNVLETVPAALCNRYIYRKYRNFTEDCKRCGVNLTFLNNSSYQINHPDKYQLVRDILKILKDDTLYREFADKCKVNSLLAIRCQEMRDLAKDGERMIAAIENHYKNVKQQISRLYRLRNAIAHTAVRENVQMVRYIEHLENYLAELVSEIIRYAGEKSTDHIEVILEMIKDNYRQFLDIVHQKKRSGKYMILENGLFCTGILNLI